MEGDTARAFGGREISMEQSVGGGTQVQGRLGRPAPVGATGWLCVTLGAVMILSSALMVLAAFVRRTLEEQGIDPLATLEGTLDPLSRVVLSHLESIAFVQILLGAVTLIIGIGFLRLRPWSRPALETLAWITLAASVASGVWGIVAWPGDGSPGPAAPRGFATALAGGVLTLAQCVVCVLLIRYLRTEEIRRLFRRRADPSRP
jgi:hypothetical protein